MTCRDRLITREEEYALIRQAQAGDISARNRLVEAHLGWCWMQAQYWQKRLKGHDVEDLVNVAAMGLMRAVKHFDLTTGHAFLTYASRAIWSEMRSHAVQCNFLIRLPERRAATEGIQIRSLSGTPIIAERKEDRDEQMDTDVRIDRLRRAINELPERERLVVQQHLAGRSMAEIGDELGVSKQRVGQLHNRAILVLKKSAA